MATAQKAPQANKTLTTAPAGEGKKKKREKKEKVKKVAWGDRDEKGKLKELVKGAAMPAGWDGKVHLPLKRGDFENPADYYNLTADRLEAKAKKLREQASSEAQLGSTADRKKAKRMKSLFEKFNEMQKELKEAGMSEEQIKAILNPQA